MVSEYSSVNADRPGNYSPNWGDLARDKGEPVHDWRAGQAMWAGFDHGSIMTNFGKMGILDYFRIPQTQLVLVPQRVCQRPAAGMAAAGCARGAETHRRQAGEHPHRWH